MNCRNGSKFLKSSILSITNQTYKNWELIFWDNNSIDSSKKIANSFKDKRIKYYFSVGNNSLSKNRNDAIIKAEGELICFLDTDDIWLPSHLENLIKLFDNNIQFAYSNSLLLKSFKNKKIYNNIKIPNFKSLNFYENVALNRNIFFGSIMIKKNLLNTIMPLPKNLNHSVDDYIILSLININKKKITNIKKNSFIYRIHSSNLTNFQKNLSAEEAIKVLQLIEKEKKIFINKIVFYERYYKFFIITFFGKNIIKILKNFFRINILFFIYFFLITIIKKIIRKVSKVEQKNEILDYIERLEN